VKDLGYTGGARGPLIHGVELQDFMSYDRAFIPLSKGLNLVCGPNGAGKSSILLGISLVLGQAQTERSRRLSDLIRWGAPEARVSLVIDNRLEDGLKLFPQRREEKVTLTRVLRRNGEYFYQLDGKAISRGEVREALAKLGIHPDNMLIIMHQLMVHRFASIPPHEKLRMLEEAVGLEEYRAQVMDALQRQRSAGEEERALKAILDTTQQSYDYWLKEYQKYQRKKELEARLGILEAEGAWGRVVAKEAALDRLKLRLQGARDDLEALGRARDENAGRLSSTEALFSALRSERHQLEAERVEMARESGFREAEASRGGDAASLASARRRLSELEARLAEVERGLDEGLTAVVEGRVEAGILSYRIETLREVVEQLEGQVQDEVEELQALTKEAQTMMPRMVPRRPSEVQAEATSLRAELAPLAHLTDEVERVYGAYAQSFEDLRRKAEVLARQRRQLEEELKGRVGRWREVMQGLLADINGRFRELLAEAEGDGRAVLVEAGNIERCGLEIRVGFRGQEPMALETSAQSGGERSVSLMAFLLALQGRTTTPFRAVDEFDVHLDPRNREVAARMIMTQASSMGTAQYLAITPGAIRPPPHGQVIVVQNVGGTSTTRRMA
jgi:chromosome segregation protein